MRALVIDCGCAGVSGDMFLAALIDLVGGEEAVNRVVEALGEACKVRVEARVEDVVRGGVRAKRVAVVAEHYSPLRASRLVERAVELCVKAGGSEKAVSFTRKVLLDLVEAERRVHGAVGDAELHQLAEPDTLVDVVGSALLLDRGGFLEAEVYATPIPLGRGLVKLPQGVIKGPAPATLELVKMHQHPVAESWVDEELSTPTGVALVVNAAKKVVESYPPMKVEAIGYGAGAKEIPGLVNVIRLVSGALTKATLSEVAVLETAVDDVSPETIGRAVEELKEEGALDVYVTPSLGKKGRPCFQVRVLAQPESRFKLAEELMKRLGTLGVRVRLEPRLVANREVKVVQVKAGGRRWRVRVKSSTTPQGELVAIKPEFSDVERIASKLHQPFKEVWEAVYAQALKKLKRGA